MRHIVNFGKNMVGDSLILDMILLEERLTQIRSK
jgi:hypothetical protein